jgi:hypothetical protein
MSCLNTLFKYLKKKKSDQDSLIGRTIISCVKNGNSSFSPGKKKSFFLFSLTKVSYM